MKRYYILIVIPLLALFIGWGDWGGGGGTGDMTKAVYDANTDNVVDSATSIVGGAASLAAVSDSCDSVRVHAQKYIEDSLDYYLLITRHNDTITVLRGNISAYIEDSLDSYTLIATLNDTTLKLRGDISDSIAAHPGGAMSGSAIMDSINNLTQIYFGDTLYLYNPATNDTVLFGYVDADGELHVGSPGTLEADSAKLGGGGTLTKWVQIGSYMAFIENDDDTTVAIAITDTSLLGVGGGADDWVFTANIANWSGGTMNNIDNACFYYTNGINDELWSWYFPCPIEDDGDAIVLDTIMFGYWTQGTEDSMHVFVQATNDYGNTFVFLDSIWLGGGGSGANEANLLPHGDFTLIRGTHDGLRLLIDCVNDGASDIRVPSALRLVYHK